MMSRKRIRRILDGMYFLYVIPMPTLVNDSCMVLLNDIFAYNADKSVYLSVLIVSLLVLLHSTDWFLLVLRLILNNVLIFIQTVQ